jgi:hypothetical protein
MCSNLQNISPAPASIRSRRMSLASSRRRQEYEMAFLSITVTIGINNVGGGRGRSGLPEKAPLTARRENRESFDFLQKFECIFCITILSQPLPVRNLAMPWRSPAASVGTRNSYHRRWAVGIQVGAATCRDSTKAI